MEDGEEEEEEERERVSVRRRDYCGTYKKEAAASGSSTSRVITVRASTAPPD